MAITKATASSVAPAAAGDLVYGSGTNDAAVLGIGTAGQVLTVNSGATAPEWAAAGGGSFVKIGSGAISAAASFNIGTPFSATYDNYYVVVVGSGSAQNLITARMRTGGADNTSAEYSNGAVGRDSADSTVGFAQAAGGTSFNLGRMGSGGGGGQGFVFNCFVGTPFLTEETKLTGTVTGQFPLAGGSNRSWFNFGGTHDGATSFNSMSFILGSGTFTGNYYVYGLEK